jgi:hypothetical protein
MPLVSSKLRRVADAMLQVHITAQHSKAGQGTARQGTARHGTAQKGSAWQKSGGKKGTTIQEAYVSSTCCEADQQTWVSAEASLLLLLLLLLGRKGVYAEVVGVHKLTEPRRVTMSDNPVGCLSTFVI